MSLAPSAHSMEQLRAPLPAPASACGGGSVNHWQIIVAAFAVIAIAVTTNWSSLGCSCLPDDAQVISSLYALTGQQPLQLLCDSFFSASRVSSTIVSYMPLPQLTLVVDFALWQTNTFGFHLSNLLFHVFASFALYLVALQVFGRAHSDGQRWQPPVFAVFFGAALFAASPIHADAIFRIGARADLMCAGFCFLSFFLFTKAEKRSSGVPWMGLSLASCLLAFLCQSMALGLPFSLAAYGAMVSSASRWNDRILAGLKMTAIFWPLTLAYLVLRFLFTGTFVDAFAGATGSVFDHSLVPRTESLLRVLYPINASFWLQDGRMDGLLSSLYFVAFLAALLRAAWRGWTHAEVKLIFFTLSWLCLMQWPACRLWHLDYNLDGGRFLYGGTAALCLLFVLLLFPLEREAWAPGKLRFQRAFASLVMAGFIVWSCFASVCQNSAWLNAGEQFQALVASLRKEMNSGLQDRQKVVVLNLPRKCQGVSMINDFESLQDSLRPPFSKKDESAGVTFVDPFYYSENLVAPSRLESMCDAKTCAFYMWDKKKKELEFLADLGPRGGTLADREIPCRVTLEKGQWKTLLAGSQIDTAGVDFVEIDIKSKLKPGSKLAGVRNVIDLAFQDGMQRCGDLPRALSLPVDTVGGAYTCRFPVSQYLSWTLAGRTALAVRDSSGFSQEVQAVRLLGRTKLVPVLQPVAATFNESKDGMLSITGNPSRGCFWYDATGVAGAVNVVAEILPNSLPGYVGSTPDIHTLSPHAFQRITLRQKNGRFNLPAGLPGPSVKVRLACLASDSRVVGLVSDPVTVKICSTGNAQLSRGDR